MRGNRISHKRKSLAERFWAKVDKTGGCWIWTACKDRYGYGFIAMKIDGKWTGRVRASRVGWELTYGPIPKGLLVCHHCDNPSCVRPDHLFLGTKSDNALDAVSKGLWGHIGLHPNAKLTLSEAREIRNLYSSRVGTYQKATTSQRKLAAKFGVSRRTIRAVLTKITWKERL